MKFYVLEPEVSGHFGDHTIEGDPHDRPPSVTKLHFEFNDWLGDDILEYISTFIGTRRLAEKLQKLGATGIAFGEVEVSKSEQFAEWNPDGLELPEFLWFKVDGQAGSDDFGRDNKHRLVVSDRVLNVMRSMNLKHCKIEEFHGEGAAV